ncbi:phage tail tape measure protein [Rhizobium sp. CECT 9324]|uniref:phage tail tape measure protein n=1 Tax=Rhizobium sp. CECT 9324 TaxID=2845820 RepID=UPI001E5411E5|nr:phage tail tape measure protein [Rhizobium sp. CECT 9324]CAH0339563.1 hypothetical protein RHI9324_01214 [Rhizobium sp. CECT 9324]
MDVSLRLRLQNQLSREAKVAERDLKDLRNEAKRLGSANGPDKLGKDIRDIGREADRAEKPVRDLERQARKLNQVTTNTASKEIRALGQAAKQATRDLEATRKKLADIGKIDGGKLDRIHAPATKLNGMLGLVASSAGSAMLGLAAFASADNVIRGLEQMSEKFRQLNRDVASVAVTAEMRTPEAIANITQSNERLAIRYGYGQGQVNDARKTYAAAGIGLTSQEAILDPTLKAAKAGDASGETAASAMIAAKQNLGVKDAEIPAALDMMAKGAKLGSFEFEAMAKNFPALGTMLAGTGRQGLAGWAELVALSQVVRMGSGSQEEAATNLQNLLSKVTSKDTVKNFADAGVSLPDLSAKAEKEGKPYLTAVMDEVMRLTGGDTFKIGELFGDQQAGLALKPLLSNRATYDTFLQEILNNSAGTVDQDYNFLKTLPKEKADRRAAAVEATASKVGEGHDRLISPFADRAVRLINPEYNRQRTIEEEPELLRETGMRRLGVENELLRLEGMRREMGSGGGGSMLGPQIERLKAQLQGLIEEEAAIIDRARQAESANPAATVPDNGDLGVSTGKIPIPLMRPAEQKLGADLSGAAGQAMEGYNARLAAEGDRAVSIAADKAAEMQRVLNFTAQPTIQPNFMPPVGASPAPGQQSSVHPTSNRINQTIISPNPQHAALRANRMQERGIRQAHARSFSDTGRRLA